MFITDFLANNYLYIIAAIPICLATLAYYNQNLLLYCNYLPKNSQGTYTYLPSRYNLPFEDVFLTTRDNVRIHAWFIRYRHAKGHDLMEAYLNTPTMIYFHGNAGNISHRLHTVKDLYKQVKCNILLVSYRGYGQSEGHPTEQGLICDAEAALNFIYERKDINHDKVYVFGRSLGGAVALRLATLHQNKIKGLIIENTFTSVPDMIDITLPYLKYFKFLSRNKWRNIDRVKELKSNFPIMFISGLQDELIPPSMMQALIDNCSSNDKMIVRFEDGTHNNTWTCFGYYKAIAKFIYRDNGRFNPHHHHVGATNGVVGVSSSSGGRPRSRSSREPSMAPMMMRKGPIVATSYGHHHHHHHQFRENDLLLSPHHQAPNSSSSSLPTSPLQSTSSSSSVSSSTSSTSSPSPSSLSPNTRQRIANHGMGRSRSSSDPFAIMANSRGSPSNSSTNVPAIIVHHHDDDDDFNGGFDGSNMIPTFISRGDGDVDDIDLGVGIGVGMGAGSSSDDDNYDRYDSGREYGKSNMDDHPLRKRGLLNNHNHSNNNSNSNSHNHNSSRSPLSPSKNAVTPRFSDNMDLIMQDHSHHHE